MAKNRQTRQDKATPSGDRAGRHLLYFETSNYYWRRAKMQAVVALHSLAVLARPKQETIPKYAAQVEEHERFDFHAGTAHRK